jgi:hypothetical protein
MKKTTLAALIAFGLAASAGAQDSKADVDDSASLTRQEFQTAMASSTPRG